MPDRSDQDGELTLGDLNAEEPEASGLGRKGKLLLLALSVLLLVLGGGVTWWLTTRLQPRRVLVAISV